MSFGLLTAVMSRVNQCTAVEDEPLITNAKQNTTNQELLQILSDLDIWIPLTFYKLTTWTTQFTYTGNSFPGIKILALINFQSCIIGSLNWPGLINLPFSTALQGVGLCHPIDAPA